MHGHELLGWIDAVRATRWEGLQVHHCSYAELARWRSGRRRNDRHYVWLVVGGRMAGEVEGCRVELGPGDVQWLLPGYEHDFASVEGAGPLAVYSMALSLSVAIQVEAPLGDGTPGQASGSRVRRGATQTRALFGMLESAWRALNRSGVIDDSAYEIARHRFHGLLVALLSEVASDPPTLDASPLDTAMRERLERYTDRHMREGVTPSDLAAHARLSPDYFTRLFRKAYGTSPRRWLLGRRLDMARLMLHESGLSVKEIAAECGYLDQRLLSRQFRERFGITPSESRRQARA
ncbi:MAG: AraC family transcriptional regulator [Planctomycetota bacterium]